MKMKCLTGAALALALISCSRAPDAGNAAEASEAPPGDAVPTEPLPDADINASLGQLGEDPAPEESQGGETPRFVGRWAAEEAMCDDAAWRFTATELHTPAGSVCRFTDVRAAPGGYDIAARCTAEGPEQDDRIELRFAESAGAMLFESDAIADAGLISCGD